MLCKNWQKVFFIFSALTFVSYSYASTCYDGFDLKQHLYFKDLDQDDLYNYEDPDIDGDGVLNFLDYDACNKDVVGEDKDGDGILDHHDFEVLGQRKNHITIHMINIQKDFWNNGIYLIEKEKEWREEELEWIAGEVLERLQYFNVKNFILVKEQGTIGQLGRFRPQERTIFITAQPLLTEQTCFQATLVHEFFHLFAKEYPKTYEDFYKHVGWSLIEENGKTLYQYGDDQFSTEDFKKKRKYIDEKIQSNNFPSSYSKLGPNEMFSEVATASLMLFKNIPTDQGKICRTYDLNSFQSSSAFQWFSQNLRLDR